MKKGIKKLNMNPFLYFVSLNKLKLVRGYSYISTFMIPFLVVREVNRIWPSLNSFVLLIIAIAGIWFAGHIDFKYIWKNELELSLTKNPEWVKKMKEVKQNGTD